MASISAEERQAFRDSVSRLLADRGGEAEVRRVMELPEGYDPGLWKALAEMGIVGLLVDEAHGGAAAGPMELELSMACRRLRAPNCATRTASRPKACTTRSPLMVSWLKVERAEKATWSFCCTMWLDFPMM